MFLQSFTDTNSQQYGQAKVERQRANKTVNQGNIQVLFKCTYKLTGIWTIGEPPKYEEKSSASRVALIKINLNSGRRGSRSFRTISRKSDIKQQNKGKIPLVYIEQC